MKPETEATHTAMWESVDNDTDERWIFSIRKQGVSIAAFKNRADRDWAVRTFNTYEPYKKEISRLFELAEARGKKYDALLEMAKEREKLLDQCIFLLAQVRPDVHKKVLHKIGLSDKKFQALFTQEEARP